MIRKLLFVFIFTSIISFSQERMNMSNLISSFKLETNDLEITRLAQPSQYFDKIGKRAGIMGYESGSFEMWVWPWKPLRNFELSFLLGTSTQPINAKDIVRTISVTPEVTILTYTYESFSVKELIIVPRDEPGIILLLDVHTTTPLTIVSSFLPVIQPMWPAGVGGQFSYWDDDANAYVISEGQWRAVFLCGSPAGKQMAAPPAHMFADNPLQFKIDVTPSDVRDRFIPIVIAGGGNMKMDSVKKVYSKLWRNAERFYFENYEYYRNLRLSTMQVITPDPEFNLAYEWGKVALDNLMVINPTLGYGMVAGFGLSGGGGRPGFAWFFGGDAFINALAFNSYGAFRTVRDALVFTQKWQRQENYPVSKKKQDDPLDEFTDSSSRRPKDIGKMAHELSQSDGLCDWWNDYHYGYNHADTTPWYLVAVGDYVRTSGDIDFLKKSWQSLKLAYNWCLSKDSDNDGLMDLKGAGLGALEFGKLVGIYADAYTSSVWLQAIKEMIMMAGMVGDDEIKKKADSQFKVAQSAFEKKFWLNDQDYYSYGATEKGEQVKEKTPWSATAMMFKLLNDKRSVKSLETFNGADLCTDWGVRSLSNKSPLFEPTNYNYGAVWPFISSFFNTAQFKHRFSLAGFSILSGVISHVFDNAIGVVPEVFSGEMNQKLGEAYHHQGFSTTGYMLPFIRGLLGLEVDALEKKISFSPYIPPNWDEVTIRNIKVRSNAVDMVLKRGKKNMELSLNKIGKDTVQVFYSPVLLSQVENPSITIDGNVVPLSRSTSDDGRGIAIMLGEKAVVQIDFDSITEVYPPTIVPKPGERNSALKIISHRYSSKNYSIVVEGLSGETYRLHLYGSENVKTVKGASLDGDDLKISFDQNPQPARNKSGGQEFFRKEIIITLK